MKKTAKKIVAVILTVIIALSAMISVSAADLKRTDLLTTSFGKFTAADVDETIYPTIVLPGLSFSKFYVKDKNGNRLKGSDGKDLYSGSFIVDKDKLKKEELPKIILPLLKSVITQSDKGLSDCVYDLLTYYTQYSLCDKSGKLIHDLELETYDYPLSGMDEETKQYYMRNVPIKDFARLVGEDMIYMYTYCPFGEVNDQAEKLVDYVDMVLEQTGAEKVNLLTMSMGTTILTAYLNLDNNGSIFNKINKISNIVPMFDGNEVITELLARDFVKDMDFYNCDFIPTLTSGLIGNRSLGYILNFVAQILPEKVRQAIGVKMYDAIANAFQYSSQAWTMVQSKRYEELRSKLLMSEECKELREKTDKFYDAQKNVVPNLIKAKEQYGIENYCFVGYGTCSEVSFSSLFCLISSNAETNSDCLVPLSSSAPGVTYCSRNSTLSDEYINSLETTKYVSPDKTVDASTWYFRDTTWFYHNQVHWAGGDDTTVNMTWLTLLGVIDDINSDPENYPQFNGCRDLIDATDKYVYLAEDVLKNADKYDAEKIAKLQKAFDEICALYKKTNLNYKNAAKEAQDLQYNLGVALADLGLCEAPEKSKDLPLLEKLLRHICYKTLTK